MAKRKIIKIDEFKCNGCGLCLPNCPEGALQIIDNKARLVSDLFCDGLGACIGYCPQGAIKIEERAAEEYNESKVMENIVKHGDKVIQAHLKHLKEHGAANYLKEALDYLKDKGIKITLDDLSRPSACPGSQAKEFKKTKETVRIDAKTRAPDSKLTNWPVQIKLVPEGAPYFNNADILIAADCVPFSYAGFHQDLLRDKILLVGCPKLDDAVFYQEKLIRILKNNNIRSVTCAHMEVSCCFGLVSLVKFALDAADKQIPFKEITISIKGKRL
ncbi:MAG: 4Fe-4S binding protein [Candidatus Omnitrophota bacterium]|nr:4Fe-4S binding protein [Candidatus Omnitrophota bacterium]MBU1929691.1 4Fe-4S binding protein [Candidatus Omnitrophota bacterium]MBU2035089.1 4Fe-4S binding protein [Candidatus Omnitrophota bacterium]MBU2221230.1 4Fe-4S binding protein [Candidatus Omnitrophota bacterium]